MKEYVDIASIKEVRSLQLKEVGVLLSEQSALVFFGLDLKTIIELAKLDMREKVNGETTMLSLLNSMDGDLDSFFDLILNVP